MPRVGGGGGGGRSRRDGGWCRLACGAQAGSVLVFLLGVSALASVLWRVGDDTEVGVAIASVSAIIPRQASADSGGLSAERRMVSNARSSKDSARSPSRNSAASDDLDKSLYADDNGDDDGDPTDPSRPWNAGPEKEQVCKDCCNDGYKVAPCFDVIACAERVPRGGKYAIVFAQLGTPKWPWMTNLKNFAAAVKQLEKDAGGTANIDIVVLVPVAGSKGMNREPTPDVVGRLQCPQRVHLETYGVRIVEIPWTVPPGMKFDPPYWQENTWCGPMDLMRLNALGMEDYDAVIYYDQDIELQGSIEPVLRCAKGGVFLSATGGLEEPLNVGFFALRPDRRLLKAAVWFAQNESYDNDGGGWGGMGFSPAGGSYVGSQCGQGFMHSLFHKASSPPVRRALKAAGLPDWQPFARQIDRCIWNYQTNHQCPEDFDCSAIRVHHKPTSKPEGPDCGKLKFRPGYSEAAAPKGQAARPAAGPGSSACEQRCIPIGANCNCGDPEPHIKRVDVGGKVHSCEESAYNSAGDSFAVSFEGSAVVVERSDARSCWCEDSLQVQCCVGKG